MPPLPAAHLAELDVRKLRGYCLNAAHGEGRHARMFRAALGLTAVDAEWLAHEILALLPDAEAIPTRTDEYGTRYNADLLITRLDRQAVIRTSWIVEPGDKAPRLVTRRVL